MATYTSHLNLKLPDYSDVADVKDLNDNFKKIDNAIASGGTGGGTGGGIVTETDPTVPSWAKQPNKPSYTADEVGALPDTTVIPTVPNVLPNPQPIVINGISYDGSERKEITVQAGSGGSITETDPTVPAWAKAATKPTYTAEEVGALPNTYNPPVKSVNGKTGNVTLAASDVGALPSTTVIPTVPSAIKNPYPLTINGVEYDGSEAKTVNIKASGGGESVSLDTTLTQYGMAADAGAVGNALSRETTARDKAINELNEANAAQNTEIAKKANDAELASVAKSGSYNDLSDKPTIPTVPESLKNPHKLTFTGAVTAEYDGSEAVSVEIPDLTENPISDIDIVYPLQRSPYYDLLARKVQNKANNANLISTEGHMAHSSMGASDGKFMCLAWGENNTEGDKSTDTSTSSGKWHVRCKVFGGYYGFRFHLINEAGEGIQETDAFDVFPAGTEILDANGGSLGTIISSSDSTVTKDFTAQGRFVITARCYMSTNKHIAVSRKLEATYSGGVLSYVLNEINPFTLTVDGVNGENNLKRVNTEWPSTLGYGSCGYSYNNVDKKFYLAATISNTGVALLSTTDFVEHTYVAFYPYDKASLECALFFDTVFISNTYKSGVYLACRSVYGHEYIRLAKLDYSNGYSVMDEVDLPAATSRPFFTQSFIQPNACPCHLIVSDYTRSRASIYQVLKKNIRNLKPIAVIDEVCCNYPAIFNVSDGDVHNSQTMNFIVCGTNGDAANINGISWFHENFKFGTYSLDDFKGAYPVIEMNTETAELAPNTFYKWGEIAALSITLATPTNETITNEYCFEFVSGETATMLTVPDTIRWAQEPSIDAGKTYQVSILNGIGVICGA